MAELNDSGRIVLSHSPQWGQVNVIKVTNDASSPTVFQMQTDYLLINDHGKIPPTEDGTAAVIQLQYCWGSIFCPGLMTETD